MEKAAEKLSFLKTKSRQLRAYVLCGFGADYGKHRLSTQVEWPDDTEILLADMPPSTASEVSSFFDNIDSLLGVIIISQPSDISALGMTRTIDFLRHKGIPIIGLVSMMDGYLCLSCGLVTHQLLSPKLAMEKVVKDCGVLKPYFDRLAKMVLKGHTIILKKQTLRQQLQQKAGELGAKTAAKYM